MEMSTYISCTFVLGQAVSSIPGKAIYILDNDGNNETSGWGGAETEKTQARNSEKEHSQGWACLPWHVLLPFGNANTTLMNTSATREFSQHLFPFNQELFWRYFKRTYFENCFYGNMVSGSSESLLISMIYSFIHYQTFSNDTVLWFDQIKFRTPLCNSSGQYSLAWFKHLLK